MMTLSQKQQRFASLVARLILEAQTRGYEVTLGEAFRSAEEAARLAKIGSGISRSLHTQRLAIDLNLFVDGVYRSDTESYRPLGEWWEAQSSGEIVCAWGGRFTRADGNHFSIEHEGRR